MKRTITVCTIIFIGTTLSATTGSLTNKQTRTETNRREMISEGILLRGLPLCTTGLLLWGQQKEYRSMRHHFVPHFNSFLDDYSQYSPLALTAAIKAMGVRSRSSWTKLGLNTAISAVLMASTVNGIKYSIKERRPDGTTKNSFPSGHTATAFMCATIMHKEYGESSIWYSIGAYTIASCTGLFRILNNRHWVNDVVFGAGVGIISGELGYFLGDLWSKNHKNNRSHQSDIFNLKKPTFFHFGMSVGKGYGLSCPLIYDTYADLSTNDKLTPTPFSKPLNLKLKMGACTSVRVEGAYFFSNYIGLGCNIKLNVCPISADYNKEFEPYVIEGKGTKQRPSHLIGIESANLGIVELNLGPYISLPLSKRWMAGLNMTTGPTFTTDFSLDCYTKIKPQYYYLLDKAIQKGIIDNREYEGLKTGIRDREFLKIASSCSFGLSTGVSLSYMIKENSAIRFFADYHSCFPKLHYTMSNRIKISQNPEDSEDFYPSDKFNKRTKMKNYSCGLSLAVIF